MRWSERLAALVPNFNEVPPSARSDALSRQPSLILFSLDASSRHGYRAMLTYPNPGVLPTKAAPAAGESIEMRLEGLPSFKEIHRSIRNPKHPRYDAFMRLRDAAIAAMGGRECYSGPIAMDFSLHAPRLERRLLDYVAGIEDTLDGSHGPGFTYLPIVYQDDCQICHMRSPIRSVAGDILHR